MSDSPKPKNRWISILLVISLALNLLIVGVALGTALRVKGGDHAKSPPGFGSALYRALPKEERKAMRGELFDRHKKGAHNRSQDFAQLSTALRANPFDAAAVQALLDQQAQSMADLQDALQQEWLARVEAMSDEERLVYADRLEEVVKRGPRGHKKKD
ncbi:periplasmic heavy metal sensor [Ruegeria atlantica]|uniref:Putative integral membrane protein n=1 Tax=Ruegeria atlantica TaxID=81569 RepID=A0A0P1EIU5_9RHOB|nr:periplasmic heavy metal sensor [Ruegeria atlantica]CUH50354.1 putative integral membrane protein [Ruegeria atlantica]